MEYSHENTVIGRDIPPALMGRLNVTPDDEGGSNGGYAPSCPWSHQCADGWGLSNHPVAMVYAPCQGFHSLYDLDTALVRGTLFSELDLPLEVAEGNGTASFCGGCRRSMRK